MKLLINLIQQNARLYWSCFVITSIIVSILAPKIVVAADIEFEDSVEYKIMEDCSKDNEGYESDSHCIMAHWGGATNQALINSKCNDIEVSEPYRCTNKELLALEINERYRPKDNNNDGDDTGSNTSGSYPNTRCFTANGGQLQEKQCPRDAEYPGNQPPDPNKCYASNLTASTGGKELYEESSCDTSTFTVTPPYEDKEEPKNEPSCEERAKLSSGWIVCSALELLSSGMDTLAGYVDDMLNVDVVKLDNDGGLRSSWSFFRAVATFMLVAIGLVMIISQAIGGGN